MTNTTHAFDTILRSDLGFEDDWSLGSDGNWLAHETEPVRFVWEDAESGSFALYRFEELTRYAAVGLVNQLRADNLDEATFRAVVRAFLAP